MKKTGATPIVEDEDLGGGSVLGAVPVQTVLVKYRDGHGQESIKLAAIVPGGEVYFFSRDSLDDRQAQTWLKNGVLKKLNAGSSKDGTLQV